MSYANQHSESLLTLWSVLESETDNVIGDAWVRVF